MTLTEFLLARIAEDEAAAKYEYVVDDLVNRPPRYHEGQALFPRGRVKMTEEQFSEYLRANFETGTEVVDARVLAECEAKRRIVADFIEQEAEVEKRHDPDYNDDPWTVGYAAGLERALEHMALPYADHPDYREEWKP